jgi:hypothetical protein
LKCLFKSDQVSFEFFTQAGLTTRLKPPPLAILTLLVRPFHSEQITKPLNPEITAIISFLAAQ